MNKLLKTLISALLAAITGFAHAGQLASLSVINQSSGARLQIWRHHGINYVAGNPGDRYAIEIKNRTGGRLLSVVSVDGINVLNGATASISQSGYVLDAQQSIEVKGWRKSMDDVAAFYFTQLPDSYAARTERPDNVGVIGIAVFQEYVEPVAAEGFAQNLTAQAPMASSRAKSADSMAEAKIGTGHGERLTSTVRMTEFRRASTQPSEIISIQYDTYAHLVARGVIPRSDYRMPAPQPFPGGFVPDPS
ncbi:MAG: hypothetical protein ACXWIN_12135 [Burkholderiaceae bacterium]